MTILLVGIVLFSIITYFFEPHLDEIAKKQDKKLNQQEYIQKLERELGFSDYPEFDIKPLMKDLDLYNQKTFTSLIQPMDQPYPVEIIAPREEIK